jgi:hypothetical protein
LIGFISGRRNPGRAHTAVRGEGGGGLAGPAGGAGPVGREAGGWAWEKEAAQERRRGSGPAEGQGPGGWANTGDGPNFQLILEFGRTLENCTRRFRKKFDMGIFLKSSRLSKYFREKKYDMP